MSKVAVIYWSGTGNTQQMAEAVAEGAKGAGAEVSVFSVSEISAADAAAYDHLALGCPAMGGEVLEESEFEPFFSELEGSPFRQEGRAVRLLRLGRRTVDARLAATHRPGGRPDAGGRPDCQPDPGRGRPHPVPRARRQDCGVRVCRIPASSTRLPGGGTLNLFLAQATTAAHSTLYPRGGLRLCLNLGWRNARPIFSANYNRHIMISSLRNFPNF